MIFKDGILIKNFELKKISSFKTGGKARYYFIPGSKSSLINILNKTKLPVYIIGNFTNILASDEGFNGVIINLKGFTNYIIKEGNNLICGASVSLRNLIDFAIKNNLGGLEKLSGIPGSLGGALAMNAGAFGTEIGEFVKYVKVIDFKGKEKIFKKNDIKFEYRSARPLDKYIIIEAGLELYPESSKKLLKESNKILKLRKEKQPLEFPSAGSVFKRPAPDIYAGKLIEEAGCKGLKIGGAMVSEKHSNFIINFNNAKSSDIFNLIKEVQKRVFEKFKITLEPEIKFLGKF